MSAITTINSGDDRLSKVAEIVRANLEEHYRLLHFDVIPEQKPTVDIADDLGYIRVFVIFDGNREDLKARWKPGLIGRVRQKMTEVEIREFPVLSFVTKSEWDKEIKRLRHSEPSRLPGRSG